MDYFTKNPGDLKVERFWHSKCISLDKEDVDEICINYEKYILGTHNYNKMGLIHAGVNPAKKDFKGFYEHL